MLPVLLIVVLGVVDFGRSYFAYVAVTNAARGGADYASASPANAADTSGIEAAALAETTELVNTSPSNPAIASATGSDSAGGMYAEVTVTYQFETLFPWPVLPDSFTIARSVRARVGP